jgi:hypothetical protein
VSIADVFGAPPLFVSDSAHAVEWLRSNGHAAVTTDELRVDERPAGVVFAGCNYDTLDTESVLARVHGAPVLWSPVGSFNASTDATIYGLERMLDSDLLDAARRNREWMEFYAETDGPVRVWGEGTDIVCAISDPLFVATRADGRLSPGEWVSVGAFLEVNCESSYRGRSVFNVTGRLRADGMLAARHLHPTADDVPAKHRLATDFVEDIGRHHREVLIEFENSQLTGCWVDGIDQLDFVCDLTGPVVTSRITEFAVGTNHVVRDTVDWSVNAQVNEGIGGVHLGVGEGVTGVHLDFVAVDAVLEAA